MLFYHISGIMQIAAALTLQNVKNTDASTRNTLSLVLDAAVVTSPFATLGLANHRRLRMVAGWKHLYFFRSSNSHEVSFFDAWNSRHPRSDGDTDFVNVRGAVLGNSCGELIHGGACRINVIEEENG